jgi:hypothetical protein
MSAKSAHFNRVGSELAGSNAVRCTRRLGDAKPGSAVAVARSRQAARSARDQLDCRGARLGGDHRIDPLRPVMQVLATVRRVYPVVEARIGGALEPDVSFDAAGHDAAVAPLLRVAVPGGAVAIPRPHIEIVAVPHDPDRHRLARRAVGPLRHDLQLVRLADLVQLVTRPIRHRRIASAKLPVL